MGDKRGKTPTDPNLPLNEDGTPREPTLSSTREIPQGGVSTSRGATSQTSGTGTPSTEIPIPGGSRNGTSGTFASRVDATIDQSVQTDGQDGSTLVPPNTRRTTTSTMKPKGSSPEVTTTTGEECLPVDFTESPPPSPPPGLVAKDEPVPTTSQQATLMNAQLVLEYILYQEGIPVDDLDDYSSVETCLEAEDGDPGRLTGLLESERSLLHSSTGVEVPQVTPIWSPESSVAEFLELDHQEEFSLAGTTPGQTSPPLTPSRPNVESRLQDPLLTNTSVSEKTPPGQPPKARDGQGNSAGATFDIPPAVTSLSSPMKGQQNSNPSRPLRPRRVAPRHQERSVRPLRRPSLPTRHQLFRVVPEDSVLSKPSTIKRGLGSSALVANKASPKEEKGLGRTPLKPTPAAEDFRPQAAPKTRSVGPASSMGAIPRRPRSGSRGPSREYPRVGEPRESPRATSPPKASHGRSWDYYSSPSEGIERRVEGYGTPFTSASTAPKPATITSGEYWSSRDPTRNPPEGSTLGFFWEPSQPEESPRSAASCWSASADATRGYYTSPTPASPAPPTSSAPVPPMTSALQWSPETIAALQ
ncbi:flocculation protein FLO11-like [Diachasma alloeum]|uniref:flocculation protein FLO11-like n=1 Tax=Diachasma alloeum TaxID=454923 RepID=UPI00073839E6|nr:flocculation protein FLO11-like [Diachasma alloeum]